ncbi:helix-turn-helix domain-containing protein [Streptomyces sp. NPDC087512]|uniref:helix-turn-helix domain-containing protein n=1 Tax=Streptomyces sp. NPDC087512 TaxID=3155059 RepID=UPI003413D8D0
MASRPSGSTRDRRRMALAADRLRVAGVTVAEVGREVGYTDGFAFSAAFKRVRGIPPSAHRGRP